MLLWLPTDAHCLPYWVGIICFICITYISYSLGCNKVNAGGRTGLGNIIPLLGLVFLCFCDSCGRGKANTMV